jgi:sigma-E factor negative regulatory protein RseA
MSEQIREQVSAFLDGELPGSETELLLKRLTRDPELRQSFGRYTLIGETLRGASSASLLSLTFATRVNRAIDGEPTAPAQPAARTRSWWKPIAGTAVAAGVAAVAVVALQQRAVAPGLPVAPRVTMQNARLMTVPTLTSAPKEALSYTVPAAAPAAPAMVAPARLTSYVFAHSKYAEGLGQGNLLSTLLSEDADGAPAVPAPSHNAQTAP